MSKCGVIVGGKYYLKLNYSYDVTNTDFDPNCHGVCPSKTLSYSSRVYFAYSKTYDPAQSGCPYTWSGSGGEEFLESRRSCIAKVDGTGFWWDELEERSITWTLDSNGHGTKAGTIHGVFNQYVSNGIGGSASPCLDPGSVPHTDDNTETVDDDFDEPPRLSLATPTEADEYTDSKLEEVVTAKLAAASYGAAVDNTIILVPDDPDQPLAGNEPDTWTLTLAARSHGATTSVGITSKSLSESKYRLKFDEIKPAFCRMKLRWEERFFPTGGGASTLLNSREMLWTQAECNPGDGPYSLESDEFTIPVPATPGTIKATNFQIDCLDEET